MSDDAVGEYVNLHFFNAYQKVGTFKIVNGQKQGGNVATYFCLPDGTVLHAIAGPVDAKTFLQEARWVVETRKAALIETRGSANNCASFFRKAHVERFIDEHPEACVNAGAAGYVRNRGNVPANSAGRALPPQRPAQLPAQAQVDWLLASRPSKINDIYKIVYQDILGERVSNLPVHER